MRGCLLFLRLVSNFLKRKRNSVFSMPIGEDMGRRAADALRRFYIPAADLLRRLYTNSLPPQREIILRNEGRVRYLVISRRVQAGVIAAVAVVVGWTAVASFGFLAHNVLAARQQAAYEAEIASRDRQIAAWQDSRIRLEQTLDRYRRDNANVTRSLEENQEKVARLGALNVSLAERMEVLVSRLDETRAARDAGEEEQRVLNGRLATLESELADLDTTKSQLETRLGAVRNLLSSAAEDRGRLETERDDLEERLETLRAGVEGLNKQRGGLVGQLRTTETLLAQVAEDRDEIMAEREQLEEQIAGYEGDVEQLVTERTGLQQRLVSAEAKLWSVLEDRSRVASERDALANETEVLTDRLAELQASQSAVLARLETSTGETVRRLEQAIEITGLDLEQMLARSLDGSAVGGPFVPLLPDGSPGSAMASRLASLDEQLDAWHGLQALLAQLPLAAPIDGYHVSSPFGQRKDPITKRLAMHLGQDLKAPRNTAVNAPAPGRVTFVGWKGAYGKFVEIDHGFGVRTRYGHLEKILVERGQEIAFRDQLGSVGSTGRSTGPHLHYEVLVDSRQQDPEKFIRAGQYVFKR